MNGTSLDEICADVLKLGKIVNREEIANNIVNKAKETRNQMSKNNINKSILLLEWIDPYFSARHWIPEQIEMARFNSVLGAKGEKSRKISADEIIHSDPVLLD